MFSLLLNSNKIALKIRAGLFHRIGPFEKYTLFHNNNLPVFSFYRNTYFFAHPSLETKIFFYSLVILNSSFFLSFFPSFFLSFFLPFFFFQALWQIWVCRQAIRFIVSWFSLDCSHERASIFFLFKDFPIISLRRFGRINKIDRLTWKNYLRLVNMSCLF